MSFRTSQHIHNLSTQMGESLLPMYINPHSGTCFCILFININIYDHILHADLIILLEGGLKLVIKYTA